MAATSIVIIVGASARAAAFSALRAGLQPWCADLFGDCDLQFCCPTVRIPGSAYPAGFVEVVRQAPAGPWLYTGGLENHPEIIDQIAQFRPLWGNAGDVLARVRSPQSLFRILSAGHIPCPAVRFAAAEVETDGHWLVKPLNGAGGTGIHFWKKDARRKKQNRAVYFQEYIEGESYAAIYLGRQDRAQLLGVTRQLVGVDWLRAAPFQYCGSVGAVHLEPGLQMHFERLGSALVAGCGLRGLFGVDCVLRDGVPSPVEVNPRYTASIEVLEYATGMSSLLQNRSVFVPDSPPISPVLPVIPRSIIGKGVLFAHAQLTFPDDGPWMATLRQPPQPWGVPEFGDIPAAGQVIKAGRPICTVFSRSASLANCLVDLRQRAKEIERWLWKI